MDVKSAFLNCQPFETIYMSQPEYFVQEEKELVYRLNRSL